MATLFNQKLLKSCVEKFHFPENEQRQKIEKIISAWQKSFKDHDLSKAKETALQGRFFAKFFCEILGYTTQDDGNDVWTLKQEAKTEVDGKEADGSLGYYSKTSSKTRCVIELKDAQQPLDKKQHARENKQTPVEQAFQYLYKFADCDWVIVSNFRYTRLYHKSKGQTAYEEFDILTLHEEKEFKKFYYCLCQKNLIDEHAHSPMDELVKQSGEACIDITKEFYLEFKNVRRKLFDHIVENNPHFDKKLLLEKTQKILDRFIFIFFCEDTAGLLPHNTVEKTYELGQAYYSSSECKIWDQFRGLFRAIDRGRSDVNPPINAYNGGLFADDEILNKQLIIRDEIFEDIKNLARYDFESDLNVNILGHIFEQSLSDLEQIKNDLDGIQQEKKNAKRKKDGIFYTPEYITQYIVKETIGRYLEDNPEKLEEIKILDPACGSGAFLNQAHSFLVQQRKIQRDEKIAKLGKSQLNFFEHINPADIDRSILLNNLYGVDLNKESVEITKLALWLKTANAQCKLNNLDENIKCGNSLIDDETIAGDKAFKWEAEFQEVIADGGFDCIIGNPPYIKEYTNKSTFDGLHASPYYQGKMDIWTLFACQAIDKLDDNGYLSFIAPNSWLTNSGASIFRNKILSDGEIIKFIDFGDFKVFKDAGIQTMIFVFKKCTPRESYEVDYCKIEDKNLSEDVIRGFIENDLQESITGITKFTATIKPKDLKDKAIAFLDNKIDIVISKISNNDNLTYIENREIGQGIVGAPDDLFIVNKVGVFTEQEKELIKDFHTRTLRYKYSVTDKKIFYICDKNFKDKRLEDYKNIHNHFIQYKDLLTEAKQKYGTPKKPYFYLHRERDERFFKEGEKIVAGTRVQKPSFYYTEKAFYGSRALNFIKTGRFNYKYLTGLLNSKLVAFWLRFKGKMLGDLLQVNKEQITQIPIKNADLQTQNKISNLVTNLLNKLDTFENTLSTCIEVIKVNYNLQTIPNKFNEFYKMGINPFIEELDKLGVMTPSATPAGEISSSKSSSRHARGSKLTLSQKEELISWYKQKADALNKLKSEIDTLDHEIDQEVYKLYNLTPEEISMIEGVSSNKML